MLSRNAVTLVLLLTCSACAGNQTYNETSGAATLPDSKVALIKQVTFKGFIFNERWVFLTYLDGTKYKASNFTTWGRVMPGRHALGVRVNWGNFCPPGYFGSACFNWCYSGVVLKAEAGRNYSYDIEKNNDKVNVLVSDDTGAVATKGVCEKISAWGPPDTSETSVIKSVNERLERESKEPEIQDKAEYDCIG